MSHIETPTEITMIGAGVDNSMLRTGHREILIGNRSGYVLFSEGRMYHNGIETDQMTPEIIELMIESCVEAGRAHGRLLI